MPPCRSNGIDGIVEAILDVLAGRSLRVFAASREPVLTRSREEREERPPNE
jgi:hypothetical protein